MKKNIEITTDHFQFYIGDSQLWEKNDTAALWKDNKNQIVTGEGLIGVGTARYGGKVHATLVVDETLELGEWKKMGDFKLALPSGKALLWGPEKTGSEEMIGVELPSGNYVGTIFSKGTETVTDEMSESGQDEYMITLQKS